MGRGCRKSTVFLSILVMFAPYLILLAHTADRITKGQSIRDGETLISSGENFKLGFFRPDDSSSTNRYLGIWFNKVSIQSVVWVANTGSPIWNSSGVLSIQDDGNLNILDGNGNSVWSTSASMVSSINSTAVLLDNGNFLLCGDEVCNTEKALWQSFEDPSDTFLPGMRVGLNSVNGETRFTSWKSSSDPSKGNFTMVFTMDDDTNGLAQIVLLKNSRRYWRSGVWNGQVFIGMLDMTSSCFNGFNVTEQGGKYYISYSSSDVVRFQTRGDGREEQQMWDAQKNEWNRFWSQPGTVCQVYNTCGAFASCSMSTSPICTCLDGFEPSSITEWNGDNWSSGCMRNTRLQCERNTSSAGVADGFLKFNGLKLPDNSVGKLRLTEDQCKNYCLENCTCKAYAYVNEIGCMRWDRELVDIQSFEQGGYTLNVRLAKSDLDKFTKSEQGKKLLWIIILCAVLGLVFLIIAAYLLWRWRCKASPTDLHRKGEQEPILLDDAEASQGDKLELPMLSFDSIVRATDNFSDANKLGQGGFGPVYKGNLSYGKEVAIKRLSSTSGQGAEEFMNEITLIAKLQHRNLVRLLGCCIQREEKILVYEYLPNKSLDAFIFDSKMRVQFDWEKRFSIIEGIARGLLYLHRDSRLKIIHRDLKASNVLLDEEMNPKISHFGLAKIFGGNQNQENTKRVVGTYGYMAPEYAMEGLFSVKSDVYSFGVLLLEIISGIKNTQYRHPEDVLNLLGYAWKLWNEEKAMEFVDPTIIDSCSECDVLRCIHVGLLCVQDSAKDRPTMSSVVLMLESEATVIPKPSKPNFTIGRPLEMGFSMDSSENISKNGVTVTMIVGR